MHQAAAVYILLHITKSGCCTPTNGKALCIPYLRGEGVGTYLSSYAHTAAQPECSLLDEYWPAMAHAPIMNDTDSSISIATVFTSAITSDMSTSPVKGRHSSICWIPLSYYLYAGVSSKSCLLWVGCRKSASTTPKTPNPLSLGSSCNPTLHGARSRFRSWSQQT